MPSPAAELLGTGPLTEIGLGLGSNIGDKAANIRRALALLEKHPISHPLTENEAGGYNHN